MNNLINKILLLLVVASSSAYAYCPYDAKAYNDTKTEQLSESEKFLDRQNPEDVKFGLTSAELNNKFWIYFKSAATLKEYETNKEKVSKLRVNPGSGAAGKLGTLIFSPFYIFSPKEWANNMVGCSDEISSVTQLNKANQKPTGEKLVVEDYFPNKTIRLKIEANGKSFEHPVKLQDKQVSYFVGLAYDDQDLVSFLKYNQKADKAELSISCALDCDEFSSGDNPNLTFSKKITIQANLSEAYRGYSEYIESLRRDAADKRKIKQEEEARLLAAKQKAIDDANKAQIAKQIAADRAAQAKADSVAKAQAAEQKILDQYKEKCSNLGFKAGTDAFGKCVLQLTK